LRATDANIELMRLRDEEGGSEPLHRELSKETQREMLRRYGVRPKRRYGQNFLIDPQAINKVIDLAQIEPSDTVVEIGSGAGALTGKLADLAAAVHAVELDSSLTAILKQEFSGRNVIVHNSDIRKFEFDRLAEIAGAPLVVVGNLPYYLTTDILFTILSAGRYVSRSTVMVQKEYAQRLLAQPGGKDYGALTVAVNFRAVVEPLMTLEPGVFYPTPQVSSTLISLVPRRMPAVQVPDDALFQGIVRAAFATRRKTLLNALLEKSKRPRNTVVELMDSAGIDPARRGETLSVEDFARLTTAFHDAGVVIRPAGKLN
jgi:16S rRNA (adenine1518-N6/adenine1519-N6)-dimethyltransferase